MTERLTARHDYPHTRAEFAAALRDPEFHRGRLDVNAGGEVVSHEVGEDSSGTPTVAVSIRQPVPPGRIPSSVADMLSGLIVVVRDERWTLGEDGLTGEVEVSVPRAPVSATGTMTVRGDDATTLDIEVDVSVTVPVAGALVEPAVVRGVQTLTEAEHRRISAWLDGRTYRDRRLDGHGRVEDRQPRA